MKKIKPNWETALIIDISDNLGAMIFRIRAGNKKPTERKMTASQVSKFLKGMSDWIKNNGASL